MLSKLFRLVGCLVRRPRIDEVGGPDHGTPSMDHDGSRWITIAMPGPRREETEMRQLITAK